MALSRAVSNTPLSLLATSLRVLVHSNVFISIAATSVAVSTMVLAGLSFDLLPLSIVFAVTLFVYSFNRLTDFTEDRQNLPGRAVFIRRYGKLLLAVALVLYLGATVTAFVREIPGAPAMAIPLLVAVLYSVVGLKRYLLVKNLTVGLSWGLIPLGVGVYYGVLWTRDVLVFALFVATMITIAAAVFDIKDIEGDSEAGISTLPVRYGPRVTRQIAATATVLVSVAVAALVVGGFVPTVYVSLLLFTGYVLGYSLFATPERGPLFYGFVVDGEHIFLALVLLAYEAFTRGLLSF